MSEYEVLYFRPSADNLRHCGHPFDDEGSYGEDLDNESESALETDTEMNEVS